VVTDASGPGLLAAFGGGLISFLSPCVLPLVPGYLSLMSGVKTPEADDVSGADRRRLLRATLLFVAGFTVVFVALGAVASAVGQTLQAHQRVFERVAGVLIIAMGLFLAGAWAPRALMGERRLQVLPSRLGPWAAPVMGMAFAFGWTPCIGPILGGVLTLAGDNGTLGRGVLLLTAYSLGLGVPFVVSGLALARLTSAFGVFRRHARALNVASGLVLAAFGVLMLFNRVSWLSTRVIHLLEFLHLGKLTRI
jgi:cytochrome c-type biogenesis protein